MFACQKYNVTSDSGADNLYLKHRASQMYPHLIPDVHSANTGLRTCKLYVVSNPRQMVLGVMQRLLLTLTM